MQSLFERAQLSVCSFIFSGETTQRDESHDSSRNILLTLSVRIEQSLCRRENETISEAASSVHRTQVFQ